MSEFHGVYRGSIFDIADPENRGRLRILVPAVLGDSPSAWAEPTLNPSPDFVPESGGRVWVQFEGGNINAPTYHSRQEVTREDIAPGAVDLSALADEVPLDGGITTFVGATPPPLSESDEGDLWLDDDDHLWRFDGTQWVPHQDADIQAALDNAQNAANIADGKMAIYYQNDPPTLNSLGDPLNNTTDVGDLWFDLNDKNKPYSWNGTAWVSVQDGSIADAQNTATQALNSANGKNVITHSTAVPSGNGTVVGDTWFRYDASDVVIGQWRWSGSAWVPQTLGSTVIAALDAGKITTGTIDVARLANIGTANIANAAITTAKIGDVQITNAKIADLAVTNAKIADLAVTSAKISSLSADKITTGTLSAIALSGNTITGATIIGGVFQTNTSGERISISGKQISTYSGVSGETPGSIDPSVIGGDPSLRIKPGDTSTHMQPSYEMRSRSQLAGSGLHLFNGHVFQVSVGSTSVLNLSLGSSASSIGYSTGSTIVNGSTISITGSSIAFSPLLTGSHIADNTLAAIDLAENSVGQSELAGNAVTSGHIVDNSVAAVDIATNGVGSSEIADNSVAAIDIVTNAITGSELADGAVGTTHLVNLSVTKAKIAANAVGTSEIASGVSISACTGITFASGDTINTTNPPSASTIPNARWVSGTGAGGNLMWTSHSNSSIRYKENLRDLAREVDPETVLAITAHSYDWREDAPGWQPGLDRQAGFMAEDLERLGFQKWLGYDEDGLPNEVDYSKWTILLQLVAQDHNRRLKDVESINRDQEGRIEALEENVQALMEQLS